MAYTLMRKLSMLRIFLIIALLSFEGCLEAFTRAANEPPTAHYGGGEENMSDALPTPQLFDFRLNLSDD